MCNSAFVDINYMLLSIDLVSQNLWNGVSEALLTPLCLPSDLEGNSPSTFLS